MLFPFFLSLFVAFFRTGFLPHLHLMAFAPFLGLLYQKKRFIPSLYGAFACGLIMDLISSELRFGLFAFSYLLVTCLFYRYKRHFFEDNAFSLSLFTALISFAASLIHLFFLACFATKVAFSIKFIGTDLIFMPLLDAIYAFLWFTCPMRLLRTLQKRGWENLFLRTK
jgi:hypothetical protein